MNLREAAQQALEALEDPWSAGPDGVAAAIIALRVALAEATIKDNLTVEPVAWISEVVCVGPNLGIKRYDKLPIQSLQLGFYKHTPLYTAPPKRKPLTDEEIQECVGKVDDARLSGPITEFARAIERAHGIRGEK